MGWYTKIYDKETNTHIKTECVGEPNEVTISIEKVIRNGVIQALKESKKMSEKTIEFVPTKEQLQETLTYFEREIIDLADEMASAMSDLNAHNYKNFVDARDKFRDKIKNMCDQIVLNENRLAKMKKVIAEI